MKTWYADTDSDGFGDLAVSQTANTQPSGYVKDSTDCDDTEVLVNPGATEVADNGIDEDCDGFDLQTWYADTDGDGYGDSAVSQTANTQPTDYVLDNTDCDDTEVLVNPGATEIEDNGVDEDCDGFDLQTWYADADGDAYGDSAVSQTANTQPTDYVLDNTDCDDTSSSINPGMAEILNNGIDDDCNPATLDNPINNSDAFITTWRAITDGESITIPTTESGYDYSVDWGDGNVTSNELGNATHNYAIAGDYQVEITGDFPRIFFFGSSDASKLISIDQWGANQWSSMERAFFGCNNLVVNALDTPDLSVVFNMDQMFRDCTNLGLGSGNWNWDTSNVNRMAQLFFIASSFNKDISTWDVSNVSIINSVFAGASSFNQDISNWDVSNTSILANMFDSATSFNQDISSWNVANAGNMFGMFWNATSFNQDLSSWNVTNVGVFDNMFNGVTLSIENYDSLLIGWEAQTLRANVNFDGGNSVYCSSAAKTARENIINNYNWTITDGGECDELISIPDVNFELALIDLGIDTNGETGNILKSQAEAVGWLDLSDSNNGYGIQNLTGIEAFINLTGINLNNNQISDLDFSFNPQLIDIYANECQIQTINVLNNPLLVNLHLYLNQILELDLSNNLLLEELICQSNQITSLDLSVNGNLRMAFCAGNQLTSINIANGNNLNFTPPSWTNVSFGADGNPNLTCIQVDANILDNIPNHWQKDTQAFYTADCSLESQYLNWGIAGNATPNDWNGPDLVLERTDIGNVFEAVV